MLSYGKVIGQLSKITRNAHSNHLYRPEKHVGFVSIGGSRYRSESKNNESSESRKPTGTTIKPAECVPGSRFQSPKEPSVGPACDMRADGSCPASCNEDCGKPDEETDGNGRRPLRYWKQLLTALIVAGATIYTATRFDWSDADTATKTVKKVSRTRKKDKRKSVKVPPNSESIPNHVPYLLVGGGTAAFSAFRSIKSRDPTAKVLVVTEEGDLPYMRPPLSKELWYNADREVTAQLNFKQWNGTQRSLFYEPPEFYADMKNLTASEKGGVAVARGWKVDRIDVLDRKAILEDGHEIKYDKCLVASGATPKNLPVFETADEAVKRKITPFRTKEDFLELEERLNDPRVKDIVIIGGGFLGSELACSLARNLNNEQKKVYQVYKEKFIMAQILPEYLSEWTTRKVAAEGVNCISSAEVDDLEMKDGRLILLLTGGRRVEADQVVVAIGARANTALAETSNLEVHPDIGGFLVNAELEARSNLWVAGDAACFFDVRLGRRRVEHHDHAVISGRLAGENMTGAGKPYLHQSMFWSDLGPEVGYEAIGIVDSSLPTVGVFVKATEADTPLATVSASDEAVRSTSEERASLEKVQAAIKARLVSQSVRGAATEVTPKDEACSGEELELPKRDDFGKGIVFYLRDDVVVGVVLWNVFNRMSIARQVLARGTRYDELNEVAKLFTIHED